MNHNTPVKPPSRGESVELIADGWPRVGTKITRIMSKDGSAPTKIPAGTRGKVVSFGTEIGVEVQVPASLTTFSRGQLLKGFDWQGTLFVKANDFWNVFRKSTLTGLANLLKNN